MLPEQPSTQPNDEATRAFDAALSRLERRARVTLALDAAAVGASVLAAGAVGTRALLAASTTVNPTPVHAIAVGAALTVTVLGCKIRDVVGQ